MRVARVVTTLVLTAHERDAYLAGMADAGAAGFLGKNRPPEQLIDAIRRAAHRFGDAHGQFSVLEGHLAASGVRHLEVAARAGLNRTRWDLRYAPPTLVALRTTPPEDPHIWEEPRFKGAQTRPVTHWGMAQAQAGPMAVPGKTKFS